MASHKDCTHPKTAAGRQKCRRDHGQLSPLQAKRVEQRQTAADAGVKAIAAAPSKPRSVPDNPHPKARYDESGWRAETRLTAPKLAGYIHKRMRRNRHNQYVFTREWVAQQYPGSEPTTVDAALQYLVDTGKIHTVPL